MGKFKNKEIEVLKVVDWLKIEHGYREYKQQNDSNFTYKTLLQKRVDSECVCECNDRLSITINVSLLYLSDSYYESYEIEIVAEKNKMWWKLSCYSMTRDEIKGRLKEVEETLVRLFNNI